MRYRSWWMGVCGGLLCQWEEAGENPALFCYRIAWGTIWTVCAARVSPSDAHLRKNAECLTPSSTSSTHCLIPKG